MAQWPRANPVVFPKKDSFRLEILENLEILERVIQGFSRGRVSWQDGKQIWKELGDFAGVASTAAFEKLARYCNQCCPFLLEYDVSEVFQCDILLFIKTGVKALIVRAIQLRKEILRVLDGDKGDETVLGLMLDQVRSFVSPVSMETVRQSLFMDYRVLRTAQQVRSLFLVRILHMPQSERDPQVV